MLNSKINSLKSKGSRAPSNIIHSYLEFIIKRMQKLIIYYSKDRLSDFLYDSAKIRVLLAI